MNKAATPSLTAAYYQRKRQIDQAFRALNQSYRTHVQVWQETRENIREVRAACANLKKPQSLRSSLQAAENTKGWRRSIADAELGAARIHQELQVEAFALRRMKIVLSQGYSVEVLNGLTAELEALAAFKPGGLLKGNGAAVLSTHINTAKRILSTLKPENPEGEPSPAEAQPSAIALCHKLLAMTEVQMDLNDAEKETLKRALFKEAAIR